MVDPFFKTLRSKILFITDAQEKGGKVSGRGRVQILENNGSELTQDDSCKYEKLYKS